MSKFILTNKAVEDLTAIWSYTLETWSERQADLYYSDIVDTCKQIAEGLRKFDKEYKEIHMGLFARHCNKHLIFYRITENDNIEVIRILHERMDIALKLK